MKFIKSSNQKFLGDRSHSLDILENLAHASKGDDKLRDSILSKIERYRKADNAQYAETLLPDGSVRLRHPSIGVVSINHQILPAPTVLFGNPSESLTAYTLTVSRAEALVKPNGLVAYEPYEVVGQFQMSELSFNSMVTDPNGGDSAVTVQKLKGFHVEPTIPSAFTAQAKHLAQNIQQLVAGMGDTLNQLTEKFVALGERGGKLSQKAMSDLDRHEIPSTKSLANNLSFQIEKVATHSQEVMTSRRVELESLISLRKTQGEE